MATYGQIIPLTDGGSVEVCGCETPEEATSEVVAFAIESGWRPTMWWEFWRERTPRHVRAEYMRQKNA